MAAGYELTAQDLKQLGQSFAQQYVALMNRSQAFAQRLNDFGPTAIAAAYTAANSATGTQDAADLEAMMQAVSLILAFATTADPTVAVVDNTAGATAQAASVAAGAYCVATNNPILIGVLKALGHGDQTSLAIRKLSPPANV